MLLDDVADLASSGGIGTVASTSDWGLYKGALPAVPDRAIGFLETGGVSATMTMATTPTGRIVLERPRLQCLLRGAAYDYQAVRTKAETLYRLLNGLTARSINGVIYHWAVAVSPPISLGRDENDRPMLSLNVDVLKELG